VAAVEGDTAIIREARAAKAISRCLPRHPRAAAPQPPGRASRNRSIGRQRVSYAPSTGYSAASRQVKWWAMAL
jgi:hypothetical protein